MRTTLGDIQELTFATATRATTSSFPAARRLSADQLEAYLDRRSFAAVGSVRPDGRPHVAMSSFIVRRAEVWLPTVAGSVRARNLRSQPWLTLVVTEGEHDDHIVVILEGPAELTETPAEVPAEVRKVVTGDWVSGWIHVQVQRVLSYAAEGTRP
jgi:hypothetical protein